MQRMGPMLKWIPALDQGEVGLTIRNLAALNWLNVKASSDLPLPAEETVDI